MLIKGEYAPASSFQSVEVKHSPVVEMVASLRVLADASNHLQWNTWAHDTLALMGEDLSEELEFLSDVTMQWSLMLDFVCYIERHNIDSAERFIASIESLDRVDFVYGLLSGLIPRRVIREAFKGNLDLLETDSPIFRHYVSVERARDLIVNEESYRHRIAAFLTKYWECVFSSTWQRIGVAELDCLASERRLLNQVGAEHYIESCHDQVRVEKDVIRLQKQVELDYRRSDIKSVVIIISTFIAPDVMVSLVDGCLTLSKGVGLVIREKAEISEEISLFLKAIGSAMKFRILFELQASPKTTKELAEILNVAPSSISAHLHQMREAELVYPQRVQNAVYYRFLYENYQANIAYLAHIFEE